MIQRQAVLGHHNLMFFIVYFSFYTFLLNPITSTIAVSSDKQYSIRFSSTTETQRILLQKCCSLSEVLNKDGDCVPTPTDFQPIVPLPLEKRIKRAVQDTQKQSIENETIEWEQNNEDAFSMQLNFGRPLCNNGTLRQLLYGGTADIQLTSSLQFVTDNFLDDEDTGNQSLIVSAKYYCIDYREPEEGIVVEFCVPDNIEKLFSATNTSTHNYHTNYFSRNETSPPLQPVLLRKCCPPSHVIDMDSFACVRLDIPWQLYPIESEEIINALSNTDHNQSRWNSGESSIDETIGNPLQVSWLTGTPTCAQQTYEVYIDQYDRYYVNSQGILITEKNGTVAKTPPTEFCIDAVIHSRNESDYDEESATDDPNGYYDKNNTSGDDKFANIFSKQVALVCFENNVEPGGVLDEEKDRKFDWRRVYAVLTGISSIFLLVTCLIYVVLRKELKLPGWLQFAYSFALLLTFSLLTVAQLWTQKIHDISKSLCRALGYGLHFSFLVCFFYLTSMNFEIFTSFRSITLAHGFGKGRGKRRFLEFTAFSLGFPTAITALLLAVDSCNPDEKSLGGSSCILPTTGIGVESCVFDSKHKVAQLQYFYGFVGVLLMINLVIFVCTLVSLRNRERETRMAKRQSTSTCDYDRLQLFTRLFLIMGILWIFEVISWLFQYFDVDKNIQDIFIVTDCLNASQGFAVFLMFVWKRQTWKQLKKKFKTSFGIHRSRPLCRPNHSGTISSNNTNGTSVKSSYLSSTKSRDSVRLPSTSISTVTAVGAVDICICEPLKLET